MIVEFTRLLSSTELREFKRTAVYQVLAHAAFCADEEIVQEMSEEFVEQHTQAALNLASVLKKSNSLLFNNIVLFLLTIEDKFGSALGPKEIKLTSALRKLVNDQKYKRSFSKEVKSKIRKLNAKLGS